MNDLATPNYAFAKRQRDLAKKAKKEEKRKRKQEAAKPAPDEHAPGEQSSGSAPAKPE